MKKYTIKLIGREFFLKKTGKKNEPKFVHVPLTCVPSRYPQFIFDENELDNAMEGALYKREYHFCDFTKNCWEANCQFEAFNPAFYFEEVTGEESTIRENKMQLDTVPESQRGHSSLVDEPGKLEKVAEALRNACDEIKFLNGSDSLLEEFEQVLKEIEKN